MFLKFKFKFKSFYGIFCAFFVAATCFMYEKSCSSVVDTVLNQFQYLSNCLPTLPQPNIDPSLLSVDCCWVRGGVGAQLLKY